MKRWLSTLFLALAVLAIPASAAQAAIPLGGLTQLAGTGGCASSSGAPRCTISAALGGVGGVATSPDGKHVYVASITGSSIVAYSRDATALAVMPAGPSGPKLVIAATPVAKRPHASRKAWGSTALTAQSSQHDPVEPGRTWEGEEERLRRHLESRASA